LNFFALSTGGGLVYGQKSCLPKAGRVLSVSIYPTEFGLKCINIESPQGPSALFGAAAADDDVGEYNSNDNGDGDDDGEVKSDLDSETENNKIRTYELNRLRLATKHRDTFSYYLLCLCILFFGTY
jgi:hypothetical protein